MQQTDFWVVRTACFQGRCATVHKLTLQVFDWCWLAGTVEASGHIKPVLKANQHEAEQEETEPTWAALQSSSDPPENTKTDFGLEKGWDAL